jgi:hypothetical protein
MRTLDLRLSIAFAVLAPLPAFAQVPVAPVDLPKVIFCSGQCFAVDEKGVRTQVTKGAILREGQRLETGPGTYAQLKVGQAAELALSERGQVRFDQRSVGGRDLVILDQGRMRMIGGDALGKAATRALELRTADGTFALKGADVEVKKVGGVVSGANPTFMKVNNGNASLHSGRDEQQIPKDAVRGVTGGKVIADRTFSLSEVALPPRAGTKPAIGPGTTLNIQPAPVAGLPDARTPLPVSITVAGTVTSPALTTLTYTTGSCLSCTTTLSPTYTLSTTSLSSPTTTSTSTTYINTQLYTASTCLTCSTLSTTSGTTTTTTTSTTTTSTTLLNTSKTTYTLSSFSLLR